jgi:hypothetical protein
MRGVNMHSAWQSKWAVCNPAKTKLGGIHSHPQGKKTKGDPFTPRLDFSLVAWKFYS